MFQLKWLVVGLAEGSLCLHSPLTEKNDIRFLMKQSKLPGDSRLTLLSAHQDTRLSSVGTGAVSASLIGITILTEVSLHTTLHHYQDPSETSHYIMSVI